MLGRSTIAKPAMALLLAGTAASCSSSRPVHILEATQSTPRHYESSWCHNVPIGRSFCLPLTIETAHARLRLAVAETDERRERGLMGVKSLPAYEGMLFVFPEAANLRRDFWMKDTIVPLDMVFVSADGIITEIDENVAASQPGAPDSKVARRHGVGRFVIELRSGDAEGAGLQPGGLLRLPTLDAR